MRKFTYFDTFNRRGWPATKELARYFLTAAGRRQFFESGNDSWGLKAQGLDGTEHLQAHKGRIDIDLTILGNLEHGVLLFYRKWGGEYQDRYYSKGDQRRLFELVKTAHGDLMPIGLFIPWDTAWKAIKEFIEIDGALPKSIEWIADRDLPPEVFPDPRAHRLS
jgi:hypothetical protein